MCRPSKVRGVKLLSTAEYESEEGSPLQCGIDSVVIVGDRVLSLPNQLDRIFSSSFTAEGFLSTNSFGEDNLKGARA